MNQMEEYMRNKQQDPIPSAPPSAPKRTNPVLDDMQKGYDLRQDQLRADDTDPEEKAMLNL